MLDGVLTAVFIVALILAIAALISLIGSAPPAGWRLFACILVVLCLPIFGPVSWFVARYRERSVDSRRSGFGS